MLQSSEFSLSIANILQAVTSAALIAGAKILWGVRGELTAIKAVLDHPELGVTSNIASLRKSRHNDANIIQSHETRLDGHDRDIERIDGVLTREPHGERRVTQTGEPYDRRTPK